jgi:hypothetical protein
MREQTNLEWVRLQYCGVPPNTMNNFLADSMQHIAQVILIIKFEV